MYAVLNEEARILLVEPKLFHVSRKEFEATAVLAEHAGFVVNRGPRMPFCWSAVLGNAVASNIVDDLRPGSLDHDSTER